MISLLWAIAKDLGAMGHDTVFGYTYTMSHSTGFGYSLWVAAQNLLCTMGHSAKPITRGQKYTVVF
jgi:hypothetical protein